MYTTYRSNFHIVNTNFVDALIFEAVEMNDLESIEAILSWRDFKTRQIGLKEVDKILLKMQKKAQEVIINASMKNNFQIVKTLYSDGYKILDKMTDDRFFFSEGNIIITSNTRMIFYLNI